MRRAFFICNLVLVIGLAPTASAYAGSCQKLIYQSHVPTYQQVQIETVAVPLFVFKYVGADGGVGGSGSGFPLTQDQIDAFADRVAAKVMAAIDQRIQKEKDESALNPQPDQNKPVSPQTPVTSKERVLAVHCAACHTAPNQKGKLAIFDSNGLLAQKLDWMSIYDRVNSNDPKEVMPPPPRPSLSPEYKKIIKAARTSALLSSVQSQAPKALPAPPVEKLPKVIPPTPKADTLPKVAIPPAKKLK